MSSEIVVIKVLDKDNDGVLMIVKDEVNVADKIKIPIRNNETKEELIEKILHQINVLYRHHLKNVDIETHYIDDKLEG